MKTDPARLADLQKRLAAMNSAASVELPVSFAQGLADDLARARAAEQSLDEWRRSASLAHRTSTSSEEWV